MKQLLLTLCLLTCTSYLHAQKDFTLDSTKLTSRVLIDTLDIPWEILWGPDDFIWTTERYGRVSRIDPETGKQHIILDLSSKVYAQSEAGMLGMVLHPDFSNSPHVFIAYTYVDGGVKERIVKYVYDGNKLTAADTLIEGIKGNTTHIGCRMIILPDHTLLVSTGDAQDQSLPLNVNSLSGKILRMNLDGSIPSDNPNPSSLVWSIGHRNAQGLVRAPSGIIYSSEHGPTTDDELNIITANSNYGWPEVHGFCDSPNENTYCLNNAVKEPLVAWTPTIAPSDIAWYTSDAIPEFKNKLLMTVLKDKSLIVFTMNSAGTAVVKQDKYFAGEFGRLRDVCFSPAGKIYLATNGNSWSNNTPNSHSIIELSNDSFQTTSINNVEQWNGLHILPNPIKSGEAFQLNLVPGHHGVFTLYDQVGRVVLTQWMESSLKVTLNCTSGMYFWKVVGENQNSATGKLLVE